MRCALFGKLPAKRDFVAVAAPRAFLERAGSHGCRAGFRRAACASAEAGRRRSCARRSGGSGSARRSAAASPSPALSCPRSTGSGRYFPLTVFAVAETPDAIPPPELDPQDAWFAQAEDFLLSALATGASSRRWRRRSKRSRPADAIGSAAAGGHGAPAGRDDPHRRRAGEPAGRLDALSGSRTTRGPTRRAPFGGQSAARAFRPLALVGQRMPEPASLHDAADRRVSSGVRPMSAAAARQRHAAISRPGRATHPGPRAPAQRGQYLVLPESGVWAVADGMGGHEAGRPRERNGRRGAAVDRRRRLPRPTSSRASRIASCVPTARLQGDRPRARRRRRRRLDASRRFWSSIGTMPCVWSGDSRLYRVRGGRIAQLSRDHTEAQELVDKGVLRADEARTWPRRNIVTRALGVHDVPELDIDHGVLEAGDMFVICSDGLTAHVSDERDPRRGRSRRAAGGLRRPRRRWRSNAAAPTTYGGRRPPSRRASAGRRARCSG